MNKNWKYGILNDAVDKGSSNISLNKIKDEDGDYPVFGAKGFAKNISFYQQEIEYLAIIKDGAGIGRVSKHPKKSSILATMQYLIPKRGFNINFINYFFNYIDFEKYRTGSTIPHIYYKDYKAEPFPLIDISEQHQIVSILDKAFTAIDKAKTNIERNLKNAKELFQSKLDEIFSQKGEGWEERELGDACTITMGQSPKGTSYNDKGIGTPLINGPVEFGPYPFSKTIMSKWTTEPTKLCKAGDLILCVRGSTTGRINIAGFDACAGRGVASIRYSENQHWLNFFIRANQNNIYNLGTGSTFPNVSGVILSKISFPLPSVDIQNSLIEKMKKFDTSINQVE